MGFDRTAYLDIKSRLDFRPRADMLTAVLVFDVALGWAAWYLVDSGSGVAFAAGQLLFPVVFFNAFAVLHECGHGSASRATWVNALVGHLASPLCGIPYYPWKYIHQKHHAWTGNIDRDPVLRSLKRWRDGGVSLLVRFGWRTWIPLGAALQHVIYWTYPIQMARDGEMTRGRALRCAASIGWCGGVYAVLLAIAPELMLALVPAVVLFLVAEELVNVPHHADVSVFDRRLPIWEQHLAARSCDYPRGLSELFVLNFNFHVEHHLYPALPWYRLRRARALLKPALGDEYREAVGLSWNLAKRTRPLEEIVGRYRTDGQAAQADGRLSP